MSTILEALADYVDSSTSLTLGVDLFLGLMPASPDACVAMFEYSGSAPLESFGSNALAVDRPRIQVLTRGARNDYPGARTQAETLRLLLAAVTDQTLSGVRVLRVSAVGSVNPLGPDGSDRPLLTVNLEVSVAT